MTLGEYKRMSGRDPYGNSPQTMPDDAEGYRVRYKDGYESWSPRSVFDEAYRPCESFLDRLRIEHDELTERINKLDAFISSNEKFAELGHDDRVLLQAQLHIMAEYQHILSERIAKSEKA